MRKLTAITAILLFCLVKNYAQLPDYHVQVINTRNGINLAGASEVIQDKKGFLWILSENTLQRFDGKSVKVFSPAPLLKNVFCDADGNVWCVAQRSVHRYVNDHTGFEELVIDSFATYLFGIHQLPDKSFWVSHTKGLMKYEPAQKQFVNVPLPFLKEAAQRKTSLVNRVIKVVEQRGDLFCLLQIDTAYVYNARTGDIQKNVLPKLNFSIFYNDNSLLLVGFDAHSYEWDLAANTTKPVNYNPGNKSSESFFYARQSLQLGPDNDYLLSNKGVLQVNGRPAQIKKIKLFMDGMPLQGEEDIRFISRGSDGKIFLLHNNAILFFEHQPRSIQTIRNFSNDLSKNLGNRPTECVIDEQQNLWIASFNGFSRWNLVNNDHKSYKAIDGQEKETLQHPVVWHIASDGKNILLSPDQQGLLVFNPETEKFSRPVFAPDSAGKKLESQTNKATVYFTRRLSNGNFLFSNRYGVMLLEKDTYRVKKLKLPGNMIYYLSAIETADGSIWFATMQGIVGIDSNFKVLNHIQFPGKDKEAVVLCEYEKGELLSGNKEVLKITNLYEIGRAHV